MKNKIRKKVFVIAEAGVNHNGSLEVAKKMIDAACEAKADAIKFQSFIARDMVTAYAPKALYQRKNAKSDETQLGMLEKLELNRSSHESLVSYCKKRNIIFISSPFDMKSIDLLNELGIKIFKIPSGEITNLPYLRKVGAQKKRVILSTGMSNLAEIKRAVSVLVKAGTKKKDIVLLHCNTAYPTPLEDVNLLAMITLKDVFGGEVGYSDHTIGLEVPITAVALGATVIEKHFTLSRNMLGPDHKASLEPKDLKNMVMAIRRTEEILGSAEKVMSSSEIKNARIARKSIVAIKPIRRGEAFTAENIGVKRPGTGLSPMKWDTVLGRAAKRNFAANEIIKL